MAATATENGHKPASASEVLTWVESLDKPHVTTGDAMEALGLTRATAQARLTSLADEGLLKRTGNGRGAKYRKIRKRNGNGNGKPVVAAATAELPGLLGKLAADCDQELARLDGEIASLEAARDELEQQAATLRAERERAERAKAALTG